MTRRAPCFMGRACGPDDEMRNILIIAQWDGTEFSGWQYQPGQRTVQGTIAIAAEAMVHHPVELWASSRTDSGVHARAMPITFETGRAISPAGFANGLNTHLPPDVSVLDAREVPLGWRARDHSVAKTYTYRLQLGARRALTQRQTWWLKRARVDLSISNPRSPMQTSSARRRSGRTWSRRSARCSSGRASPSRRSARSAA